MAGSDRGERIRGLARVAERFGPRDPAAADAHRGDADPAGSGAGAPHAERQLREAHDLRGVADLLGDPGDEDAPAGLIHGIDAVAFERDPVLVGEMQRARDLMERLLRVASPLGLFAEEFDVGTGRHLGNFPQAFSHLALIEAGARIIVAERLEEIS